MSDLLLMGGSSGLPRNGLVGLWDPYRDTYGRNVLPVAVGTFSTYWQVANLTWAEGTTAPEWDAVEGAYRFRISPKANGSTAMVYNGSQPASVLGVTYYGAVWVKAVRKNIAVAPVNLPVVTVTPAEGWTQVKTSLAGNGSTTHSFRIYFTGDANIGDVVEFYAKEPQQNIGYLFPYSAPSGAPSTLQTGTDYSGNGNHLTLGANTNASTDDPAYTGVSMLHAADYLLSGNLAGITMAGDWTLPLICKPSGTANTLVSLASAAAADQYQAIEYNGSTKVRIKTVNGSTVTTSDDLTVSATAVQMLLLTSFGGTLTLKRMDTGTSVTAANASPTGTPRLCVGALGTSTVTSSADALEWHLLPIYGRALTAGEAARTYTYAKSLMAQRGVTVA